jgi:3-hydroxybutyryl-CoA dehydratase
MLTSSFYSKLVGIYLPGKFAMLQGIDIDFHLPVFVGEPLLVAGAIEHLSEAYKRLEIKATIRNGDGKLVSKAAIRVGLREH